MANGATSDERFNSLENVTKTIGNLLDGYDIRLRPNFGGAKIPIFNLLSKFNNFVISQVILYTWVSTLPLPALTVFQKSAW